jgi:PAS domain-containing protein
MSSSTKPVRVKNGHSNVANDDELLAHDQTQSRLRISELRYRRLFEAARDGILILDAVTLKITDVNPFMTELLGYSHAEFLGKELWEIGLFSDKEASQRPSKSCREQAISATKTCRFKPQTESLRMWSLSATYTMKIVIKLYSATSATSLIESERRKNGRYSWQRHNQHARKLIWLTASRMSFLPSCHMNCGLLLPRSSAGHI